MNHRLLVLLFFFGSLFVGQVIDTLNGSNGLSCKLDDSIELLGQEDLPTASYTKLWASAVHTEISAKVLQEALDTFNSDLPSGFKYVLMPTRELDDLALASALSSAKKRYILLFSPKENFRQIYTTLDRSYRSNIEFRVVSYIYNEAPSGCSRYGINLLERLNPLGGIIGKCVESVSVNPTTWAVCLVWLCSVLIRCYRKLR